MSIGNLSSAPDQTGLRSEHDAPMDLHLSLPDGLAHESVEWFSAGPSALGTALVQSADDEGDDDDSGGGSIIQALFLPILIVVGVYFLLLRPRQRQMRQQRELQSSLEVGDEVMLSFGVYGFITAFEPSSDVVWVEIDDDVQIRVRRAAISGKVDTTATATATAGAEPGDATAEPAVEAPRRPTLKGGGSSPKPPAGTTPAPGPATADSPTDEPPAE